MSRGGSAHWPRGRGGMLVGVISDTHGLLRPEALERLAGVAHILHAGDIGGPEIVTRLRALAPVTAIRGNVDLGDWARAFPAEATVALAGRRLHLVHDLGDLALDPAAEGIDVVVSGHSHRPRVERVGRVLYLNPGSAGRRRFRLPVTLATLELDGAVEARLHDLLGE